MSLRVEQEKNFMSRLVISMVIAAVIIIGVYFIAPDAILNR